MVTITEANFQYVGSIKIDEDLMDAAYLIENEKVQVENNKNANAWRPMLSGVHVVREPFA